MRLIGEFPRGPNFDLPVWQEGFLAINPESKERWASTDFTSCAHRSRAHTALPGIFFIPESWLRRGAKWLKLRKERKYMIFFQHVTFPRILAERGTETNLPDACQHRSSPRLTFRLGGKGNWNRSYTTFFPVLPTDIDLPPRRRGELRPNNQNIRSKHYKCRLTFRLGGKGNWDIGSNTWLFTFSGKVGFSERVAFSCEWTIVIYSDLRWAIMSNSQR